MDVAKQLQNQHLVKKIASQDQLALVHVDAVKTAQVKVEYRNNVLVTKIVKIANVVEFKHLFRKLKPQRRFLNLQNQNESKFKLNINYALKLINIHNIYFIIIKNL